MQRGKRGEKEEREEENKGRAEGGQGSETRSIEAVFGRENRSKDGGNCGKFRPFIPRQWGRSRVLRKFSMRAFPLCFLPFLSSSILFFSLYWFEGDASCISAKHFVSRSFLRRSSAKNSKPSREKPFSRIFTKFLLPGECLFYYCYRSFSSYVIYRFTFLLQLLHCIVECTMDGSR